MLIQFKPLQNKQEIKLSPPGSDAYGYIINASFYLYIYRNELLLR